MGRKNQRVIKKEDNDNDNDNENLGSKNYNK